MESIMKLFLDACSIMYLLESHQQQGQATRLLITQALQNKTQLIVSRLSFLECRVVPLKEKNAALLASYDRFFQLSSVQIIELTTDVINIATDLRANYSQSLRTPDALQIACALSAKADQFLTGHKKLSVIQGIDVIIV
jgi:predicted nucleic acid-binding protein